MRMVHVGILCFCLCVCKIANYSNAMLHLNECAALNSEHKCFFDDLGRATT